MRRVSLGSLAVAFAFLFAGIACGSSAQENVAPNAGSPESGVALEDGGGPAIDDAGARADTSARDAEAADAGGPFGDILGTLSGSCGLIRAELTKPTPSLFGDTLAFVAGETYDKPSLSPDGQRLFDTPNAGGSSGESEVMSFEVLRYCEGATLLKTETEVVYGPPPDGGAAAITDILVQMNGMKVGVSVTRAYKPQNQGPQTDAEVKSLLEKKLAGINASSARVSAQDKWVKQILHVFAATQNSADAVGRVLPTIDSTLRADTIVFVTRTTGGGFVYCNPDPPLGQECP